MDNFEAKAIKPYLRFIIGDVVYLKSDMKRKNPMTITRYVLFEDETDYNLQWPNSQNTINSDTFADETLTM